MKQEDKYIFTLQAISLNAHAKDGTCGIRKFTQFTNEFQFICMPLDWDEFKCMPLGQSDDAKLNAWPCRIDHLSFCHIYAEEEKKNIERGRVRHLFPQCVENTSELKVVVRDQLFASSACIEWTHRKEKVLVVWSLGSLWNFHLNKLVIEVWSAPREARNVR